MPTDGRNFDNWQHVAFVLYNLCLIWYDRMKETAKCKNFGTNKGKHQNQDQDQTTKAKRKNEK